MSEMQIAIIGAGPSGCFTAQFIKRALADAQLSLLDRLPVPYGLVRYGVAPDHVGTKQVVNQFDRQLASELIHFFGHVEIGKDVSVAELESCFDVVVWATGLQTDRKLGVPGESLDGVWGGGEVTRFLNDHPEACNLSPQFGSDVVVIGNGNVAIDIARILAKRECDFDGTEVSQEVQQTLDGSQIKRVHLVGRSSVTEAKFDVVMIRELKKMEHIQFKLGDPELLDELTQHADTCPKSKVLLELITESNADEKVEAFDAEMVFHFNWVPKEMVGDQRVEEITLVSTRDENLPARQLKASSVITAIGFQAGEEAAALNEQLDAASIPVLKVGWCKRGPTGKIADNRNDAKEVANQIAELAKQWTPSNKQGHLGLQQILADNGAQYTDFSGWQKIDTKEKEQASSNRVRKKMTCINEMLATAKQ